jgi:hypothetical protein
MNRLKSLVAFFVVAFGACEVSQAQAIDPIYGFPFGYTLGAQFSLRNRLPAPPYFSIYPPVYYGKRYMRPYGESPYASFPLLGQTPDYSPVPAGQRAGMPKTIKNPYAPCCSDEDAKPEQDDAPKNKIVDGSRRPGSMRIIVNPYAQEQLAAKE